MITREISNNGGRDCYSPSTAQERAETLKARPKERKLGADTWLHDTVAEGLADDFSPVYLQARGELRTELTLALRTGRARRVPRGSTRLKQARIRVLRAPFILFDVLAGYGYVPLRANFLGLLQALGYALAAAIIPAAARTPSWSYQ